MERWPGEAEKQKTTFGSLSRSELMSRVRSKGNATTELRTSELLEKAGIEGWKVSVDLIGKPDFVWLDKKVALFVDGCFWHGHDCGRNLTPKTNAELWQKKIRRNQKRDRYVTKQLRKNGWSVIRIWECQISKNPNHCVSRIKRLLTIRS